MENKQKYIECSMLSAERDKKDIKTKFRKGQPSYNIKVHSMLYNDQNLKNKNT